MFLVAALLSAHAAEPEHKIVQADAAASEATGETPGKPTYDLAPTPRVRLPDGKGLAVDIGVGVGFGAGGAVGMIGALGSVFLGLPGLALGVGIFVALAVAGAGIGAVIGALFAGGDVVGALGAGVAGGALGALAGALGTLAAVFPLLVLGAGYFTVLAAPVCGLIVGSATAVIATVMFRPTPE